MKADVTQECIACEQCVDICPEVFQMGDDFAEVQVSSIPAEHEVSARKAVDECPVEAIVLS